MCHLHKRCVRCLAVMHIHDENRLSNNTNNSNIASAIKRLKKLMMNSNFVMFLVYCVNGKYFKDVSLGWPFFLKLKLDW